MGNLFCKQDASLFFVKDSCPFPQELFSFVQTAVSVFLALYAGMFDLRPAPETRVLRKSLWKYRLFPTDGLLVFLFDKDNIACLQIAFPAISHPIAPRTNV